MATEGAIRKQGNLVAAGDYSAATNAYRLIQIDTAANDQGKLIATANVRVDAIMVNHPGTGQAIEAVDDGYGKCQCGAAIASAGLELTTDNTGRATTAASTNVVWALSRNSTAAAGEFVGVKFIGPYVKP